MPETFSAILIKGARVLTPDGDPHLPAVQDILVRDGIIAELGTDLEPGQGVELIDASSMLATPGFVNAHYHSHDTLAKGTMEETPLETWRLLALPPQYPKRSRAEIRARTLLGALE